MYWVAQQRIVAWLVAGIVPALVPNSAAPSLGAPATQPAVSVPSLHFSDDEDKLNLWAWPDDGPVNLAQPTSNSATAAAPPPPQPINNPLPPAFWSALSVFGLLGLCLGWRRLKAQLR
jgi:hypothetical protein